MVLTRGDAGFSEVQREQIDLLISLCVTQISTAWSDAQADLQSMVEAITHGAVQLGTAEGASSNLADVFNELLQRMQFADRLTQRLDNTCSNLQKIARRLDSHTASSNTWNEFLTQVRGQYTTAQEREAFDAVFPCVAKTSVDSASDDDIELF